MNKIKVCIIGLVVISSSSVFAMHKTRALITRASCLPNSSHYIPVRNLSKVTNYADAQKIAAVSTKLTSGQEVGELPAGTYQFPAFTKTISYLQEIHGKPALVYTSGTARLVASLINTRIVEQQSTVTDQEIVAKVSKLCSCIQNDIRTAVNQDIREFGIQGARSGNLLGQLAALPTPLRQHYKNMIADLVKNQPCDIDSHATGIEISYKKTGDKVFTVEEHTTKLFLNNASFWNAEIARQKEVAKQHAEVLRITDGKDPHVILGIPATSSVNEAKGAYYALRSKYEKNTSVVNQLRNAYLELTKKHQ